MVESSTERHSPGHGRSRLTTILSRGRRVIARRGMLGTFQMIVLRAYRAVRHRKHFIFEHDGSVAHFEAPGLKVTRYQQVESIPHHVLQAFGDDAGQEMIDGIHDRFREGSVCYIAEIDGEPGSILWSRKGSAIDQWYVPLRDEDFVLYAMYTMPKFRGRRAIRALMAAAISTETGDGGLPYSDCRTWNRPSKRAMEAMGFKVIGLRKALPRRAPKGPHAR